MPLTFKEEFEYAQKSIDKEFGIVKGSELTEEEQRVYNHINPKLSPDVNIRQYIAMIDAQMSETVSHMRDHEGYGKELAENGDESAKQIVDKINALAVQYREAKRDATAKREAFEANDAVYKQLYDADKKATADIQTKTAEASKKLVDANNKAEAKEAERVRALEEKQAEYRAALEKATSLTMLISESILKTEGQIKEAETDNSHGLLDALKETLTMRKANLVENIAEIQSLQEKINNAALEIDDKHELKAEQEKNAKEYLKSKKAIDKLVEKQVETSKKLLKAEGEHDALYKASKEANELSNSLGNSYASERQNLRDYASHLLGSKMNSLSEEFRIANDYKRLEGKLPNDIPNRTPLAIMNGADTLNDVYQSYKKNHWAITRALRNVFPWISAATDYKKFDTLRTKYMEYSGVKREDIDKFLDSDREVITGELKVANDVIMAEAPAQEQIEIPENEIDKANENVAKTEPVKENEKALEEDLAK